MAKALIPVGEMVELQRQRWSVKEIAAKAGCSPWKVTRMLKGTGYDPMEEHLDSMLDQYQTGESINACLAEHGIRVHLAVRRAFAEALAERGIEFQDSKEKRLLEPVRSQVQREEEDLQAPVRPVVSEAQALKEFLEEWGRRNCAPVKGNPPPGRRGGPAFPVY